MNPATNPRSLLHALQPIGVGTPEVESLLSYFCRLSHSHSASTLSLARRVAELFEHDVEKYFMWHERKISGLRESALTWSSALSALTSVPGLDGLTFVRWRGAISQNGLSMVSKGQFCPVCLAQDKASGQTPYFRLAWESRAVSVCPQHRVPLTQCCPTCGKDNIRHAASFVVPGWCTKCGEFLGKPRDELPGNVCDAEQVWKAVQVGKLLAAQDRLVRTVDRQTLMDALTRIIDEMDGGRPSTFAARVGIAKGTVHHWFEEGGVPTLDMSLKIVQFMKRTSLVIRAIVFEQLFSINRLRAKIHSRNIPRMSIRRIGFSRNTSITIKKKHKNNEQHLTENVSLRQVSKLLKIT